MAPGGIRPQASKRVIAKHRSQDVETSRVTRSKKNYAARNVALCTQVEGQSNSPAEIPIHVIAQVNACSPEQVGHNFAAHTSEVDVGQDNECHNESNEATLIEPTMDTPSMNGPTLNDNTQNEQTHDGINFEDPETDEEEDWIRGDNMGRGLERMSQSKKGKLPLVIEVGRIRPSSLLMAAKFATECNIAVRNHVPILPRWKDYKDNPLILKNFIGKAGARFNMDITVTTIKKACSVMLKKAVCQQRYKLKKKYFDPFPLHLVPKVSPVKCMTDEQWDNLVGSWKQQNRLDVCQQNRVNRGLVQLHQTTGSRSYDIHTETLDKMERKIATLGEDGEEPTSVTDAVSKVLVEKTKKNKFLVNVGIQNKPSTSNAMQRDIEAELVREKQGSDELLAFVNAQRQQIDAMGKQLEESETARAKYEQEMKEKQAETDALLRRLMSMIPHATG